MIFSSIAIANTVTQSNITLNTTNKGSATGSRGDIVWDNGMDYVGLAAAQYDATINFDTFQADDFEFAELTEVCDVHWIGGYWNGDPAPFSWGISFYIDNAGPVGTPYAPTFAGPFIFTDAQITKIDLGSGYYEMSVDLPDNIPFPPAKYWISIWGIGTYPPQSGWGYHETIKLLPALWGSVYFEFPFWTPGIDVLGVNFDCCFQLTTKSSAIPKICCEGNILFEKVKAGSTVNATFKVCNCGEPGSLLNWKVDTYPTWGTWTFTPGSGTGLAEGDCVTITVEIVAPADKKKTFTGKIKMMNSDNASDFCEIDVSLTTPKAKTGFTLIQWILQQYPNMFPILRHILA